MGMRILLNKVIVGDYVKEWCKLPYPGHPHGCPNYNKRANCPPNAPDFFDVVDPPYYLVYQTFDLAAQINRMLTKHPGWSRRQAACCLYWQRGLMNRILREAKWFARAGEGRIVVENPEGAGVNLFATCRLHGIILKKNPRETVVKMVIVGQEKEYKPPSNTRGELF